MNNYTEQTGYFSLPVTEDGEKGSKWMHFSWNFRKNLKKISGLEYSVWAKQLLDKKKELDDKKIGEDVYNEFFSDIVVELSLAALAAHDQEQGNDLNYNFYVVNNWLNDAAIEDPTIIASILDVYNESMKEMMGKTKGLDKPQQTKKKQK